MRLNVLFLDESNFNMNFLQNEASISAGFGEVQTQTDTDYNHLTNKPSINSVVLEGALNARDLGLGNVYYDTTEHWDANPNLVAEEAGIYIYSDYQTIEDGVGNQTVVAGLKIGDGHSYLIDIPFVTDAMTSILVAHIANSTVHITAAERAFWNNKVSAYMDHTIDELLVLSKNTYEDENGDIVTI